MMMDVAEALRRLVLRFKILVPTRMRKCNCGYCGWTLSTLTKESRRFGGGLDKSNLRCDAGPGETACLGRMAGCKIAVDSMLRRGDGKVSGRG